MPIQRNWLFTCFTVGLLGIVLLSACAQAGQPVTPTDTPTPTAVPATDTPTATATLVPTATLTPTPTANPALAAKLGTVDKGVTYCMVGQNNNIPIVMDVYYPATMTGPWPAVVSIHGGAWALNDRTKGFSLQTVPALNAAGILVISINYRLAPEWHFPAMVEDAKCAVRFLRANAGEYNVDPNAIGVMGDSVGGQLALLVGLTDASAGWDASGSWQGVSSQVQAVADFFGPTDLTDPSVLDLIMQWGALAYWNITYTSPELKAASPISYVKKDSPPIIIFQGNEDGSVPLHQSQKFYDAMSALGAPVTFVLVKGGQHEFYPVYHQDPTTPQIYDMTAQFFADHLKNH